MNAKATWKNRLLIMTLLFMALPGWAVSAVADSSRKIEDPVRQSIKTQKNTQKQEEEWRQERDKLISRYESLQQESSGKQEDVEQLKHQLESARLRVVAKEKQLADIEQISEQIDPFLKGLVIEIKELVDNDLPFLTTERSQRIERLVELVNDSAVAVSEKYRKVMEALQIEAEYGFSIETYQETVTLNQQTLLVDLFRLGRLGLFCLSLDGRYAGFFNTAEMAWQTLPSTYNQALQTAIEIAAKRRPVELLSLPLGRLVVR